MQSKKILVHDFKIVSSGGHIFTHEYLSPEIRNLKSIL